MTPGMLACTRQKSASRELYCRLRRKAAPCGQPELSGEKRDTKMDKTERNLPLEKNGWSENQFALAFLSEA